MLGIIGGSALTHLAPLTVTRREVARTPYGEPSSALTYGRSGDCQVIFLARHGYGHTLPPHLVNYRANIWALKEAGVSGIISVASVSGIRADLVPGTLVVPHQIIDYTQGRASTFFDSADGAIYHVNFADPYDEPLRRLLLDSAQSAQEDVVDQAVYAVTQGPRLETAAEIRRIESDGGDIVGMTGMPEAVLARELNVPYATLSVVSAFAAGRGGEGGNLSSENIREILHAGMKRVHRILEMSCKV